MRIELRFSDSRCTEIIHAEVDARRAAEIGTSLLRPKEPENAEQWICPIVEREKEYFLRCFTSATSGPDGNGGYEEWNGGKKSYIPREGFRLLKQVPKRRELFFRIYGSFLGRWACVSLSKDENGWYAKTAHFLG